MADAFEFALFFQLRDEVAEVVVFHADGCRNGYARSLADVLGECNLE
jgi:hypothetical protein